jgi:hypothetical protein
VARQAEAGLLVCWLVGWLDGDGFVGRGRVDRQEAE